MAYTKTNWVDGTTPISAANLNNMENGIANATAPGGFPTLTTNPSYIWSGTIPSGGTVNITHNLGHVSIIRFSGYRGNVVLTTGDDANANVTTVSSINVAWTGTIYFW